MMGDMADYLGWLAGLAMVAAMIPTQVRTIRLAALLAGALALAYFAVSGGFGAGMIFAAAFTLGNAMRLVELLRRARRGNMSFE